MNKKTKKITENEEFVLQKKLYSVMWSYFGYNEDDMCRQCLALVAATRGNTTNLFDHLPRHYIAQNDECKVRTECRQKKKNIWKPLQV